MAAPHVGDSAKIGPLEEQEPDEIGAYSGGRKQAVGQPSITVAAHWYQIERHRQAQIFGQEVAVAAARSSSFSSIVVAVVFVVINVVIVDDNDAGGWHHGLRGSCGIMSFSILEVAYFRCFFLFVVPADRNKIVKLGTGLSHLQFI